MNRDLSVHTSLPPQAVSVDVLTEKYAKDGEQNADQVFARVARGLSINEPQYEKVFLEALHAGFVPAGRICSAAGTGLEATLINCFVQPIADCTSGDVDGVPGIYQALSEAAETMRRGGGVGYDFSAIRPSNALVRSTKSLSSGPVSYMHVFDRSCQTVESAGSRRGAQMGVLRVDHPDIRAFITAKDGGALTNFNMSVRVSDAFMDTLSRGGDVELWHEAQPSFQHYPDAFQRDDGCWVYTRVKAEQIWDLIMRSTYDHAEPGILFDSTINGANNLRYCETIVATNPCGEQALPPYGACDLGSIDLTRFVKKPFVDASFDFSGLEHVVSVAVRMLDNVLDVTLWPLEQQRREAQQKRRIGLGFMGLGSALVMLGLRYDTEEARSFAAKVAWTMRVAAYRASALLAAERGPFPLFSPEYLQRPMVLGLPDDVYSMIQQYGVRNSHLLSIAPTGTITLAFADNVSNGIEPAFTWSYIRKKRLADGGFQDYEVEDHAFRLFKAMGGDVQHLPSSFVCALEMSATAHLEMVKAVQPHVCAAISKTVNVPADYPFEDFKSLYLDAWHAGLKGITTYRPNKVLGAVLSVKPVEFPAPQEDPDRRLQLDAIPSVVEQLQYPSRPLFPNGNQSWCFMMDVPSVIDAGLFVGEDTAGMPFEAWVNGVSAPRGLGAVAKMVSIDMRVGDVAWTRYKLEKLLRCESDEHFEAPVADGSHRLFKGVVPYFAHLVNARCESQGLYESGAGASSPLMESLLWKKEPKTRGVGGIASYWDIKNPRAGDDCVLFVKEISLPDGSVRPCSMWLAGYHYPKALDGLCKLLSVDMAVRDTGWIALKLKKLLNYAEPSLDFMSWVPGNGKQEHYPSTVAYIAALLLYRYQVLGLLDEKGDPVRGGLEDTRVPAAAEGAPKRFRSVCPACQKGELVRRDGCDRCDFCQYTGSCG